MKAKKDNKQSLFQELSQQFAEQFSDFEIVVPMS